MGRITVNGSTAYFTPYKIKHSLRTEPMGMPFDRVTGDPGFNNSFISTTSTGGQTWTTGDYGESISVTTPSGLRIYYGGSLLTIVEGSSVVSPKERYSLLSGTESNINFGDQFLTDSNTQQAYILLQGAGGGGGKGGTWGVTSGSRDGGGGGGGAGGIILVKYTLGRNNRYNFTAGSGGNGATVDNGTGSDGGMSSFTDGGTVRAQANGGKGGKGKAGAAAEGGAGGSTTYHSSSTQRIAYKTGSHGGSSNSIGGFASITDFGTLSNTFGFTYKSLSGSGTMATFTNGAANFRAGGTAEGDDNRGVGGSGGSSLHGNGGSVTKTSAGPGGLGAGGGGGTSKSGGGGPSGGRGGEGFVHVYF